MRARQFLRLYTAATTAAAAAIAVVIAAGPPLPPPPCPCVDASLCQPIRIEHEREVLGWGARAWSGYDWDAVTMVAHSDDKGLVCRAHAAQARVLRGCEMNISEIFVRRYQPRQRSGVSTNGHVWGAGRQ